MSPSPNSPLTDITYSPGSTTPQIYKVTDSTSKFSTEESQQKPQTPSTSISPAFEPPWHQSSIKLHFSVDPQEGSSTMAFAKPMGRASPALRQGQLQKPMSPSSDSQTADNEDDHGDAKGKGVGPPPSDNASVKKKRTRTLTTPHQAAVLHALLAQVRTTVSLHCFSSIGSLNIVFSHASLPQL